MRKMNSLALPLAFGDPTPWQLGFGFIYPSLIVHMIFGLSIGLTARGFLRKHCDVANLAGPAAGTRSNMRG